MIPGVSPRAPQRTFPHRQHPPALVPEAGKCDPVAVCVSGDLLPPELLSGLRPLEHRAVVRVPETAVHEDYRSIFREHKVRPPGQLFAVEAKPQAAGMESAPDCHLGLCITSSHARHVQPALFLCENVGQRITPRLQPAG